MEASGTAAESAQARLARLAEWGALILLVGYLCAHTMPRAWGSLITDFPTYYLPARLALEGQDTSRVYEWEWLEREKDHRAVEVRETGMVPTTTVGALALWPLSGLKPLAAKRVWILLNLVMLVPLGWMLRSMTGLNYRRIALAFALSFPLQRNLQYGQFYIFLLLLLAAAIWSYLRGWKAVAGSLLAVAAACKIFPALLFVFFLRRREWCVLTAGAAAGAAVIAVAVAVFGWHAHWTYLREILPWSLRGDAAQPYGGSASISSLLHTLLLDEPQWNPHPWHRSVMWYSLLAPLLQIIVLTPAVLLVRREDRSQRRILLEWSALMTASLAASTVPALYHFVLMALPVCVLAADLLERRRYGCLAALVIVYAWIGLPVAVPHGTAGLRVLLYAPRLPLMLGVLAAIYWLLWRDEREAGLSWDWTRYTWAAAMAVAMLLSMRATLLRERAVRREYAYRMPLRTQEFMTANPQVAGAGVRYVAFSWDGYHLVTEDGSGGVWSDPPEGSDEDDLSFTSGPGELLVERGGSPESKIVDLRRAGLVVVQNARDPMISADSESFAFVRDERGRGRLMARRADGNEIALTPTGLNVYEATFVSEKEYAFAATEGWGAPRIYLTDATHANATLELGEARYPALSPDGRWLAYSRLEHGVWNLWVRNEETGAARRVGDVPCNEIQPAWEADSKTLLYGTDCGRSLWFTAVARRRVVP